MIFGHEGLPRSGKSLEAMQHVVDALLAGRTIITNIYGINHQAIASYVALPLDAVKRLLVCLEAPSELDEEKKVVWIKAQFLERRVKNCLMIWDEINQFWPPERQALPAEWARFVTEHGQEGIDVLIMGQDLTELHATWRKRLQRYTRFTKKDMMGKEDEYHWSSLSNSGRGRFKQTAAGSRPYNKDFFGFYRSHKEGVTNKSNYKDGRYSVFQAKHKFWMAIYAIFLLAGAIYMWQWFHPSEPEKPVKAKTDNPAQIVSKATEDNKVAIKKPEPKKEAAVKADEPAREERIAIDYLDKIAQKQKLRIGAFVDWDTAQPGKRKWDFVLEALDDSFHVRERFSAADVYALGWDIEKTDYGFRITKQGVEYVLRPWPIDLTGRVSSTYLNQAREASRTPVGLPTPAGLPRASSLNGADSAPIAPAQGEYVPRVTVVNDSEYGSRPWR